MLESTGAATGVSEVAQESEHGYGGYHLALDPFDNSDDEASDADTVKVHSSVSGDEDSDNGAPIVTKKVKGESK